MLLPFAPLFHVILKSASSNVWQLRYHQASLASSLPQPSLPEHGHSEPQ
jgi:hypothetical protein